MSNGNPRWLLKIDDDSVAKIETLEAYLKENYSNEEYLYMGALLPNSQVLRVNEKWAELNYKPDDPGAYYPIYANGCCGYVLSNRLVRYIGDNADRLFDYHNEDASMGIWINESGFGQHVRYVDETDRKWYVSYFRNGFFCSEPYFKKYLVLGHNLNFKAIRRCYNYLFDRQH